MIEVGVGLWIDDLQPWAAICQIGLAGLGPKIFSVSGMLQKHHEQLVLHCAGTCIVFDCVYVCVNRHETCMNEKRERSECM